MPFISISCSPNTLPPRCIRESPPLAVTTLRVLFSAPSLRSPCHSPCPWAESLFFPYLICHQTVSFFRGWVGGFKGFPGSSAGKESACSAGDPGLIPGSGRSPGEGVGYPLQYSWASLVAQMVKNPPAKQETWVWSLSWEDPLEEGMAAHSSIIAWRIPMGRGAWQATVYGVLKWLSIA